METRTLIKCSVLSLLLCIPVWANAAGMQEQQGASQQHGMAGSGAMQSKPGMQQQTQMSSQERSRLMNMQIRDINKLAVVNADGDRLGKVEKLVQNKATNQIDAVVSVGGFLGIGSKDVTIPLNQLQLREGNLITNRIMTKEQLKQQTAFQQTQYKDIDENKVLANVEGAGMGQQTRMQASFQDLDTDHNGVISKQEAQNHEQLTNNWNNIDQNADNQIDRSEFSAFETMRPQGTSSAGSGGMMQQQK